MGVNLAFIGGAGWQFFDNNGLPLNGGKIYTYAAGTTTPQTTYTSYTGTIANSNPIILDSAGRTPEQIWATEGVLYKYVVADSNDVIIRTWDNIGGFQASDLQVDLASTTNNAKGDALIGFKQSNASGFLTGAVGKTLNQKMQELVSVKDFGAVGDGVTDDTLALNLAATSARANGFGIYLPATKDSYLVSDTIDFRQIKKIEGPSAPIKGNIGAKSLVKAGAITAGSIWLEVENPADGSSTAGNVGIEFEGMFVTKCTLYARGFNEGIKFAPPINGWFVSCSFTIINLYNNDNHVHVDLTNTGTYFIGNQFIGGNWNGPGTASNNKGVFKITLVNGIGFSNVDIYNAEIGIFGSKNATNYAICNIENASPIGFNAIKFINCRLESYDPFSAPIYWVKISNDSPPNYFVVDMNFTSASMTATSVGLVSLGLNNTNRFYLSEDESSAYRGNNGTNVPLPIQVIQANDEIRVTNRIMYDLNVDPLNPVTKWTTNVLNREQRVILPNTLILGTTGTQFGLRYSKENDYAAMIVLPEQTQVYVKCYNAAGSQLTGTSPSYCEMTLGNDTGTTGYRGITKTIWLHPLVAQFELLNVPWSGLVIGVKDAQSFYNTYGRGPILPVITAYETSPNLLASSNAIQTYYQVGTQINGTGSNGWRCTFYHRTTTSASASGGQPDIVVTDPTGITIGDRLGVELNAFIPNSITERQFFHAAVSNVVGSTITLASNLPSATASGRYVLVNRWVNI